MGESISILKTADASKAYPNSDPVFDNDLTRWVRFANSVRLRLAMRIRYADETLSRATVTQCMGEPLMERIEHDASSIETEGNGNSWFNTRTGFPEVRMSVFLIDKLPSTNDPRLSVFVAKDEAGGYSGMINGITDLAFQSVNYDSKSDMGLAISSKESKRYLMTAAETWLLRAEAALVYDNDEEKAKEYFRKGIETSLKQWEIESSAIDTFMESSVTQLEGDNKEEQIGNQMYLALVPDYYESWTYIRRTGYPVIPVRTSEDLSRGDTNGIMPRRFNYSTFEIGTNEANVQEAIQRQGSNLIDTPVWWDKNE
ncbi:MAG: SusD/RagB family nutrient-binding outer membrane lipoprotein [Bacteroidetes bacterium]|nr:SusD/RagB family nutrient-binding outer membrane lipoprotein [Bacteroidota bacterium]